MVLTTMNGSFLETFSKVSTCFSYVFLHLNLSSNAICRILSRSRLSGASLKTYHRWVALRNYAVAPLAEELIYRAAVAFLLANCLPRVVFIVLTPPLFFGAAHLHHYLELRHSGHPSRVALAAVCALCRASRYTVFFFTELLRASLLFKIIRMRSAGGKHFTGALRGRPIVNAPIIRGLILDL